MCVSDSVGVCALQAGGALIGPHCLGIIQDVEGVRHLAELGVVFLLFNIGLELSLERLRSMQKYVFGMGTAQVRVSAQEGCGAGGGVWEGGGGSSLKRLCSMQRSVFSMRSAHTLLMLNMRMYCAMVGVSGEAGGSAPQRPLPLHCKWL